MLTLIICECEHLRNGLLTLTPILVNDPDAELNWPEVHI